MDTTIKQIITVSKEKEQSSRLLLATVQNFIETSSLEQLEDLAAWIQPQTSSSSDVILAKKIAGDYYSPSPEPVAAIANHQALMQRRQALL
ncbi:MAG: hypothetical protein AAFN00_16370, partial [Cyanobacteria bacterium J06558_2]